MRADMEHEGNGKPTPVTQPTGKTRRPSPDGLLPPGHGSAVAKPGRRKPGIVEMGHEGNEKPTPVTQPTGKTRRPSPDGLLPPGHGSAVAKPGRRKPGRVEMGHEGNEIPTPVRGDIESEGHEKPTPVRKNNAAGGKPGNRDEETILPEEADMEGPAGNFMRAHAESEGNGRPTPATQPTGKTRLPAADGFVPRKNGAAGGKPNRYEEAILPEEGSMEGADGSFVVSIMRLTDTISCISCASANFYSYRLL
nr:cuticle collagen 2-like [Dermacentor andersoni]